MLRWKFADSVFLALERVSKCHYDLVMVDFAFADEEAKQYLWGKQRSQPVTKEEASGRLLTLRDLAVQYAEYLAKRRVQDESDNLFRKKQLIFMRSMSPNLGADILGPVFPNRFNETRAAFPNAVVTALDPRNEFYCGDVFYDFYDCPRGREFYRQLVGGHYLRIVENHLLRAFLQAETHLRQEASTLLRKREPAQYDVFLSHATADSKDAESLYSALTELGFAVYIATRRVAGGDPFAQEIRNALRHSRALLVLLTPDSIKSEWVLTECGAAWAVGARIIPVLLRCDTTEVPEVLRGLQCVNYHQLDLIGHSLSAIEDGGT